MFSFKTHQRKTCPAGSAGGGADIQVHVVPSVLRAESIFCLAVRWDTVGHPCSGRCCLAMCRVACFSIALKTGSVDGVWQVGRGNRVKNPPKML